MEKYRNFYIFIILIPTPDFLHFYYMLGGNLGSLLYGDVSVMETSYVDLDAYISYSLYIISNQYLCLRDGFEKKKAQNINTNPCNIIRVYSSCI